MSVRDTHIHDICICHMYTRICDMQMHTTYACVIDTCIHLSTNQCYMYVPNHALCVCIITHYVCA